MSTPRLVLMCHDEEGGAPLERWIFEVLDDVTAARVVARVNRLEDGNFGDVKPVGEGVSELRMDFGPGYRLYFGQVGNEVHLIRGGTKATQRADIAAAKEFWRRHGLQDHAIS